MMKSPNRQPIAEAIWMMATNNGTRPLTDEVFEFPEAFADQLGVTRRTVENAFRAFEADGALVWYRKGAFGSRRPFWPIKPNPESSLWSSVATRTSTLSGGAL